MEPKDVTHFDSPTAFRDWLKNHHTGRDELWVGYWKKSTRHPSITWEESVDEALCFGWIDGIRKRVDQEAYTIRFTPIAHGVGAISTDSKCLRQRAESSRLDPLHITNGRKKTRDGTLSIRRPRPLSRTTT